MNDLFLQFLPGSVSDTWTLELWSGPWCTGRRLGECAFPAPKTRHTVAELMTRARWYQEAPCKGDVPPDVSNASAFAWDRDNARLTDDLAEAMPADFHRALGSHLRALHGPRLVLDFSRAPEAAALPWDGMPITHEDGTLAPLLRKGEIPVTRLRSLRDKPMPAIAGRLRVLVVAGSHSQGDWTRPAVPFTKDTVRELIRAIAPQADVAVAAGRALAAELARGQVEHPLDHIRRQDGEHSLEALLCDQGPWHVVVYIGHSDAIEYGTDVRPQLREGGAHSLMFQLDGKEHPAEIEQFVPWLATAQTRLVVLNACRTLEHVIEPLLTCADHVVAMTAIVRPELCKAATPALFEALAADATVSEAVARMRLALWKPDSEFQHLGWVPVHAAAVRADRPFVGVDEDLLARHRQQVREQHKDLLRVFFGRGHGSLQDQVPVQLTLSARGEPAEQAPGQARTRQDSARQVTIQELPHLAPGHFVLLGPPGSGKTTTLRDYARWLASSEERPLPVFVHLRTLLDLHGVDRALTLQTLLDRATGSLGRIDALAQAVLAGRAVLLLDGLDELTDAQALRVRELLAFLHGSEALRSPILLTSRASGFEPVDGMEPARVEPLDEPQQRALLLEFLRLRGFAGDPGQAVDSALVAIQRSDTLRGLATNPLLLTLLALDVEQGTIDQMAQQRHGFLDRAIDRMLRAEHRQQKPGDPRPKAMEPLTESRQLLQHLAAEMTRQLTRDLGRPQLRKLLDQRKDLLRGKDADVFLDEVRERTQLLMPVTEDHEGSWGWWHRQFQEALTAKHLAGTCSRQELLALAKSVVDAAKASSDGERGPFVFWAEPFTLLSGHLRHADDWVLELTRDEKSREIGLQAVSAADSLERPDQTLRTVLEKHCKDYEERAVVYGALGRRFGRGAQVLELLGEQVARSRDWNERWFLYEALTKIAAHRETPRELAERATAVRESMFGVERWPEGLTEENLLRLFDRLPGRADLPLWRPILSHGTVTFRMGSTPEEEPERKDDEGPVQVELTEPFWMAATPVTEEQFRLFDPRRPGRSRKPQTAVTWYEAVMCTRWLTRRMAVWFRQGWRPEGWREPTAPVASLPWEAWWEFAARAGSGGRYHDTNLWKVGWFDGNWERRIHAVAELSANSFGLFDVHGNVWEWCADWYGSYRKGPLMRDPHGPAGGSVRVQRGGSFWNDAAWCRAAHRSRNHPGLDWDIVGFRIALSPIPEP